MWKPGEWDGGKGVDVRTTRNLDIAGPDGCGPAYPPPAQRSPATLSRGVDLSDAPISRLLFPPRIEKLLGSRDFYVQSMVPGVVIPAVVGAVVVLPGFQVPLSQVGWLQQISIYVLTPTAATQLLYTVRINQGPVAGFEALAMPPGVANAVFIPRNRVRVNIPNNALVDMIVTNVNGAGPWTVGHELAGWYHAESAELRAWNLDV
jgi:hypothetical protein